MIEFQLTTKMGLIISAFTIFGLACKDGKSKTLGAQATAMDPNPGPETSDVGLMRSKKKQTVTAQIMTAAECFASGKNMVFVPAVANAPARCLSSFAQITTQS